jgi:hypothetical protein
MGSLLEDFIIWLSEILIIVRQKFSCAHAFSLAICIVRSRYFNKVLLICAQDLRTGVSRGPHMHIFSEGPIKTFSRFILAVIPLTILLIPIVIVSLVKTTGVRLAIVFLANVIFVMILSVLARPGIGELFVARATYESLHLEKH